MPPEAPSTCTGTSIPAVLLELVERGADIGHRLVRAVEGGAEDGDDGDRVLVAVRNRPFRREVVGLALHRHEAHLDFPVVGELLPADLDVRAHDDVGLVGGLPVRFPPLAPAPLERHSREHRRLARAGRRAAGRLVLLRSVPEVGEDVDAARLEGRGLRILVLVDHVLVEALGHQALGLGLHPRRHERGHVQTRVAVEHQLVVDDLIRDLRRQLALGELVPRDPLGLERVERGDQEVRGLLQLLRFMFEGHRSHSPFCG